MHLVDRRAGIGEVAEDDGARGAGANEHGLDGGSDHTLESPIELPQGDAAVVDRLGDGLAAELVARHVQPTAPRADAFQQIAAGGGGE